VSAAPNGHGQRVLEELSPAECLRLLATEEVGRVVYTDGALPAVRPVNYALDGHNIVFRVEKGSRLAEAIRDSVVAFEVDSLDRSGRIGWSVVATGVANLVNIGSELTRAISLGVAPWAPGNRAQFVRVTPGLLSGRRVTTVAGPFAE
jgi:nitroimidazol reductase NimA-like FMN-containing flavoprotein (pyridoxamine 5'-phosphate oxidase superfamily)